MSSRFNQLYIGTNLKMYKTNRQTLDYLDILQNLTRDLPRPPLRLFVLPSYTALADACRTSDSNLVWVGAQNVYWEQEGQFTGEISPRMLSDIGVKLVMVGHAERRQIFGETDDQVNRRVLAIMTNELQALVCVGDTLEEKDAGISANRLRSQLKYALKGVNIEHLGRIWVAYEPVWSIGIGGIPANPEIAHEMHGVIRQTIQELFPSFAGSIPILYGGSVNLENADDLICSPEIDGLFIGRAAWDAHNFYKIIRLVLKAHKLL